MNVTYVQMAVVKSPKNNKRKTLWMSKFCGTAKNSTLRLKKVKSHSKGNVNSFRSLVHRRRYELLARSVVPFYTE